MARKKDPHSLRSYADYRGVSLQAVQFAIRDGRITATNGKILDFARADLEWNSNSDSRKVRATSAQRAAGLNSDDAQALAAARVTGEAPPRPKLDQKPKKNTKSKPQKPAAAEDPENDSPEPDSISSNGQRLTMARTAETTYRAKISKLKFEEMSGNLISIDSARNAFFQIATSTREKILSVPDRVAEMIAAVSDPWEIREILENEIRIALADIIPEKAPV
jgi:hypothetical protein